jgi:phage gp29-like protein
MQREDRPGVDNEGSGLGGHGERYLSVEETAEILDKDIKTIYRMVTKDIIPTKRVGTIIKIPESWVLDYGKVGLPEQEENKEVINGKNSEGTTEGTVDPRSVAENTNTGGKQTTKPKRLGDEGVYDLV